MVVKGVIGSPKPEPFLVRPVSPNFICRMLLLKESDAFMACSATFSTPIHLSVYPVKKCPTAYWTEHWASSLYLSVERLPNVMRMPSERRAVATIPATTINPTVVPLLYSLISYSFFRQRWIFWPTTAKMQTICSTTIIMIGMTYGFNCIATLASEPPPIIYILNASASCELTLLYG